jgi:hypothetical protein
MLHPIPRVCGFVQQKSLDRNALAPEAFQRKQRMVDAAQSGSSYNQDRKAKPDD